MRGLAASRRAWDARRARARPAHLLELDAQRAGEVADRRGDQVAVPALEVPGRASYGWTQSADVGQVDFGAERAIGARDAELRGQRAERCSEAQGAQSASGSRQVGLA